MTYRATQPVRGLVRLASGHPRNTDAARFAGSATRLPISVVMTRGGRQGRPCAGRTESARPSVTQATNEGSRRGRRGGAVVDMRSVARGRTTDYSVRESCR